MSLRHITRMSAPLAALAALTVPAVAHPGHASLVSYDLGPLHWLTSADHGLAMVAAGVLAAGVAGYVSQASARAALRVGGGAIAALGLVLFLV